MPHTTQLTFGPLVSIEITRDAQRRLSCVKTLFQTQEEGYLLEADGESRSGTLYVLPSRQAHEYYKEGEVYHPRQQDDEPLQMDYELWLNGCMQQATAWARSTAIQAANNSIGSGEYDNASQTYHDVIDHFPPPPDGPLLHWNYYRCIAKMEGIEAAKDGLQMWIHEAIPIAGIDVINTILDPAKDLLGEEPAIVAAKEWLQISSPHDPAHKMTKRWMERINQGELRKISWRELPACPVQNHHPLLIPLNNGDLMVAGGIDSSGRPSPKSALWSNKSKSWTPLPPLPVGLKNHSGIAINKGSVIILGGTAATENGESSYSKRVFQWSYSTGSWKEIASLQIGREFCGVSLGKSGQIIVIGGENPLQTQTSVEYWDRRSNNWMLGVSIGLSLQEIQLQRVQDQIIIAGASVSSSGFGAILFDLNTQKFSQPKALQGIGLDGAHPISSGEIVIWTKKSGEINVGIWSPSHETIHWTCKEIELPHRGDLACVYPYEDNNFTLLFSQNDENIGSYIIDPTSGTLTPLRAPNKDLPPSDYRACPFPYGLFVITPQSSWLLSY